MKQIVIGLLLVLNAWIAQAQTAQSTEPAELGRLRESWQRAKEQANAPIDRKYVEALHELKVRLTKAGNLDQAVLVDAELKKVSPDTPDVTLTAKRRLSPEMLTFGEWKFENKAVNFSRVWIFTPDYKFKLKGASEPFGTWRIKGNVLHLDTVTKNWNEFDLDMDESGGTFMLHETNSNSGKRKGVVLTRLPSN
jgi:hypothetical protein